MLGKKYLLLPFLGIVCMTASYAEEPGQEITANQQSSKGNSPRQQKPPGLPSPETAPPPENAAPPPKPGKPAKPFQGKVGAPPPNV